MLGSAWTFSGMTIRKLLGGVGGEGHDALGLLVLVGGAELVGVVAEQVLEVELALGVELLELDHGALAEAALDRVAVEVPLVVDADVDAAAGHAGAGPGADVAEDDGAAGGHVLEGEALGVGAVDDAAAGVVERLGGLAGEDDVGAARGGCRSASRPSPARTGGRAGRRRRRTCRPSR